MMRLPWWPNESDDVTPELRSIRQELDELLVELKHYEQRLNEVVEQPAPRDRVRRRGLTGE